MTPGAIMRRIRPYIEAAIGGGLFLLGVLGAIDIVSIATGHAGLFAGQWQRYPSWCLAVLIVFIPIVGRWLDARERKNASIAATAAIDRARKR